MKKKVLGMMAAAAMAAVISVCPVMAEDKVDGEGLKFAYISKVLVFHKLNH